VRARLPDRDGYVLSNGVKIHYEVFGDVDDGRPTLLLMPSWTIIHRRFWKLQVPYLASRYRVVTYDGPGNGKSDHTLDAQAYGYERQMGHAVAVLDATHCDRAVPVALSQAATWALHLAAEHPDRVLGLVTIGATVGLTPGHELRAAHGVDPWSLPASGVPQLEADPPAHWAKYDPDYWAQRHEDFLWFFFGRCFPEPRSTKQIEDCVRWGLESSGEVLIVEDRATWPDPDLEEAWCRAIACPMLAIHGDNDLISPQTRSERIVELTGGELVVLKGSGHIPLARDPVKVNHLIVDFVDRIAPLPARSSWTRSRNRAKRVLYISSPIGLGHARRDLAVAQELRELEDGLQIDWLAQHPVTRVLENAGESVHPASSFLASESGHVEHESGEHDLHCFEALRRMDEILVNNFHVFDEVVREDHYDLVIGDEAWDVDHFLHENPELKRYTYAWFTDFVGYLPMPDGGRREALVAADYNAEMIEHIERYPRLRDRAIFVGDPDDIVPDAFGDGLPMIRDWTEQHYDFCGYITGVDPTAVADRQALRSEFGWTPDERVCVVTVGGSGVGGHLLRRVDEAFDAARDQVPNLRMFVVTGPRIDNTVIRPRPGLEVHDYVPELHRQLAASDIAVVQGGLTTTMELTASGRPFVYIPLRHHFEQNFHVAHRLDRYRAGRRMDYDDLTPEGLAEAITAELGREPSYRPVDSDGARRAAAMLAELL
jgi:pimeloyl-ACP methyl ester carboxylesterase/predicted glycosyltransferase